MKNIMSNKEIEMSYYGLYLKSFFEDFPGNEELNNDDFINARAEQAAEEFERLRRENYPVSQAQEGAMRVLLFGVAYE